MRKLMTLRMLTTCCAQLPVGADRFGYCLCLKDGQVVHERKPKKYASACAETGTVIGIYIYLPERDVPAEALPTEPRDKFWWKNSGKEYYLVHSPAPPCALCSPPSHDAWRVRVRVVGCTAPRPQLFCLRT